MAVSLCSLTSALSRQRVGGWGEGNRPLLSLFMYLFKEYARTVTTDVDNTRNIHKKMGFLCYNSSKQFYVLGVLVIRKLLFLVLQHLHFIVANFHN